MVRRKVGSFHLEHMNVARKFKYFLRKSVRSVSDLSSSDGAILLGAVVKASSLIYFIKEYVCDVSMLMGPSMLPTFKPVGVVIVLSRVNRWTVGFKVGEVVIADSPRGSNQNVCKRILGMEGDLITVPSNGWFNSRKIMVPRGHVWLEGDNRDNSLDSRAYGPVPLSLIRGKVVLQLWPASAFGFVRHEVPETRWRFAN